MKAITTIISIVLFVLSNNSLQAQVPVTRDFLKSKIWVIDESHKATMRFTDTEIIYYIENDILTSEKYHLSDKNCSVASFEPAKVGLIAAGNYIFYEKGRYQCGFIEYINPSEFKIESHNGNLSGVNWTLIVAKP